MKKLFLSFLLAAFFSLTMAGTAAAANWVWVDSDDHVGIFFDSASIKFEQKGESLDENAIYVWWCSSTMPMHSNALFGEKLSNG